MSSTDDVWMTAAEVAVVLRLTPHGVRNLIRTGRLPASQIGRGRYRILRSDVDGMLRKGRVVVPKERATA